MKLIKKENLAWFDRFTYRKAVPFMEKDFNQPGTQFQIVCFPSHSSIGEHWHKKTRELFFVESGRGTAVINAENIDLTPGDILLCEPGDHHAFSNTSNEDLVLLDFKINAREDDIFWQTQSIN
ncbi:MAG: cupin domain-containing protein [Candidatus Magasanikbacteria bacterium]|nr:cupin domain-containing protein [Candidatus Magasanikbacteria bacterium]